MERKTALGIGIFIIAVLIVMLDNPFRKSAIIDEESGVPIGIKIGQRAPNFLLKDLEVNEVRLSDYRGKEIVLVNFWATWCGPCEEEMPLLDKKARDIEDFEVLAVNLQEDDRKVREWLDERNLTLTVLMDPRADVKNAYRAFNQPLSYFIDKNGIIRDSKFGALVEEELDEKINVLRSYSS